MKNNAHMWLAQNTRTAHKSKWFSLNKKFPKLCHCQVPCSIRKLQFFCQSTENEARWIRNASHNNSQWQHKNSCKKVFAESFPRYGCGFSHFWCHKKTFCQSRKTKMALKTESGARARIIQVGGYVSDVDKLPKAAPGERWGFSPALLYFTGLFY